jgi:uncharacterized OB-fold protein
MALTGEHLGMKLAVDEIDAEFLGYFEHLGRHDFSLQRCTACGLQRFPPTTGCPWCACREAEWRPVSGRGTVYSYVEVRHAINPAFRDHLPYLALLVELDQQRGRPTEHEAIRMFGNLVAPDGALANEELVSRVGIGTRVRMVYQDIGEHFALPEWTVDEAAPQPQPWRAPV